MTKYQKKKNRLHLLLLPISFVTPILLWGKYFEANSTYSIIYPILFSFLLLLSVYGALKKEYVRLDEHGIYIPGIPKKKWRYSEIGEIKMTGKNKLMLLNKKMKNMVTFSLYEPKAFLEEYIRVSKK